MNGTPSCLKELSVHPSSVCMFVKDHQSVFVDSSQCLEPGRKEWSLRDKHGMNRTSALL